MRRSGGGAASSCSAHTGSPFLFTYLTPVPIWLWLSFSCHCSFSSQEATLPVWYKFVLFHLFLLTTLSNQTPTSPGKEARGCPGAALVLGKEQVFKVLISSRPSTWIHLGQRFARSEWRLTGLEVADCFTSLSSLCGSPKDG